MIILKNQCGLLLRSPHWFFAVFKSKCLAQNTGENDVYRKIGAVIVSFARRMIKGSI